MPLLHILIWILFGGVHYTVIGADNFNVSRSANCYDTSKDVVLIVDYTGAGTPISLQWKFSKMLNLVDALNVVIGVCQASTGADQNFPISRMSYSCDNTAKQYNTTISNFNETSDAGTWEVALSVGVTFTNFQSVEVTKCSSPDQDCCCSGLASEEWICGIIITLIIIGCILVIPCVTGSVWGGCMLKGNCRCCSDERQTFPNWYYKCEKSTWGLIFPVAFGIWVAKKCCGNYADNACEPEATPMKEKEKNCED